MASNQATFTNLNDPDKTTSGAFSDTLHHQYF